MLAGDLGDIGSISVQTGCVRPEHNKTTQKGSPESANAVGLTMHS